MLIIKTVGGGWIPFKNFMLQKLQIPLKIYSIKISNT